MVWFFVYCVLFTGSFFVAKTLEYGLFVSIVFSSTTSWGLMYAIHRAWRVRRCLNYVKASLSHNLPYTNLVELIEVDYGNPPDFKHPAKAGLIGLIGFIPCIFLAYTVLSNYMSSVILKLILAPIIAFPVSFFIGLVTTRLAAERTVLKRIIDTIQEHDKQVWMDILHSWKATVDQQTREGLSRKD